MSRRLTAAVTCGYVLDAVIVAAGSGLAPLRLAAFSACLVVVLAVQLICSSPAAASWTRPVRGGLLAAQALAVTAPVAWAGPVAVAAWGFLGAAALLLLTGRPQRAAFAVVVAGAPVALVQAGLSAVDVAYGTYFTLLTGLMLYGVASLAALAQALDSARGDVVRMAMVAERLRLARDMHDLLGFSLSALLLKSELAYRLLPAAPDLAASEVADVVSLSRQALDDVRSVPGGCGAMSLAAEVEAARSMLAAAEIDVEVDVEVDVEGPPLPGALDSVLAVVLREAATNILRHSKAEHAAVRLERWPGGVTLHVASDGATPRDEPVGGGEGSGLGNLAGRLRPLGGDLEVSQEGSWFRLAARAPLDDATATAATTAAGVAASASGGGAERAGTGPAAAPAPSGAAAGYLRVVRTIVLVVLGGYGLLLVVNMVPLAPSPVVAVVAVTCAVAAAATQARYARAARAGGWPERRGVLLGVQLGAVAVPLLLLQRPWGSMGGFLAGSVLLAVRGRRRWAAYLAVGVAVLALGLGVFDSSAYAAYLALSTWLTGLVVYGVSMLAAMVLHVEQVRHELARLAVKADRLRTAQELNDVLGRNLLAINARLEVTRRLVETDPGAAKLQLADVADIARRTVEHVRTVARTYRTVSLARELEGARLALDVAGIAVDVQAGPEEVPPELDALLGLALRQLAAEALDHAGATRCRIRLEPGPETVCLRVADDGARPREGRGARRPDLCERVGAVGGSVTSRALGGWHEIAVEVPRAGQVERTSPS